MQRFALQARVVANALRAIRAVLRAGASLDRQQRADLHRVRVVMRAMHALRMEEQVHERKGEELFHLGQVQS